MPSITVYPKAGVNEREPTTLEDNQFQDCTGAEYRSGQNGIFVARGRKSAGSVAVTGKALYEAGFDGSPNYVLLHAADTLYGAQVASALAFSALDSFAAGSTPIVGTHYASRHYLATSVGNRKIELGASGLTSLPIGMSVSTLSPATIISGTTGLVTAVTGLVYWTTEYDSVRGIESVTGASTNTGPFSLKASVQVIVTGTSSNPRADRIRWYRSIDGGGYPDGGLIQETAIGTTTITDSLSDTSSLNMPLYGLVSVGGQDNDRDAAPPVFSTIVGPFQDSLLAVSITEPRNLRFTPAGYPDSWPALYAIPIQTGRNDQIVTGVVLPGRVGVFCNDSVHAVYRLPRDSDSIFAPGEMELTITEARGCVSRKGACAFTPSGGAALAAFVARDGIWTTNLVPSSAPLPATDEIDWEGRVDTSHLYSSVLEDDPANRRLVFSYWRATDTTAQTGIWYIDYQDFVQQGLRITFADHGPLADFITVASSDGTRTPVSLDSRSGNGTVYYESSQDVDDSHLLDSSGSINFRVRTKEFLPGGARAVNSIGHATWMHGPGPPVITHRYYFDRRDDNPQVDTLSKPTIRNADQIYLGRQVNSLSVEIESTGTVSYGVHWIDIQISEQEEAGGREGA